VAVTTASIAGHAAEQRRSSVSGGEEEKWESPSPIVATRGIRQASPCGMVVTSGVRSPSCHRARPARPVKRRGRLTSGLRPYFVISRIFNHSKFEIWIGDLSSVQNSPNFASR
jgi:hypothetical protein